jgi:hypothetical protein
MAQFRQGTPEKQLLDLIEKPKNQKSLHAAVIKYQGLSLFSFGALKGRVYFLKNKIKDIFKEGKLYQVDIKTLNQFLKFCVFILAFYFVINLAVSIASLKKDLNLKIKFEKRAESESAPARSLLKTLTYYLEKARERDIFNMGMKVPLDIGAANRGPSSRILEATKDLRLVGIAWSDDPDVMIEDTKNQRTLFLKKGQSFDNDVKLKAVYKDRVILSYGGEEIELR